MRDMIGVSARSTHDALAAVEWIIREGADSMIELDANGSLWARTNASLLSAVRDYLAGKAVAS